MGRGRALTNALAHVGLGSFSVKNAKKMKKKKKKSVRRGKGVYKGNGNGESVLTLKGASRG